jgi:hypothetical protein
MLVLRFFEGSQMKSLYIIILNILYINEVPSVFSLNISGYCGTPNIPYNAEIVPLKEFYVDGDIVECLCENRYIDFKQSRKCQKGEWIGSEFLCGIGINLNIWFYKILE